MKIQLFEPLLWNDIVDYPDLGSAMLVSSCKTNRIDVDLVVTQKRAIEFLFCSCSSDILRIFNNMSNEKEKYELISLHSLDLEEYLLNLYQSYYSKKWEYYFNSYLTNEMRKAFLEIISIQQNEYESWGEILPVFKYFSKVIENSDADVIGFSMYEFTPFNQKLLKYCKSISSKPFIIGGAFTGHLSESDILYLRQLDIADYLVLGQAEFSLPNLIIKICENNLDRQQSIENVLNLKNLSDSTLTYFIKRNSISDLDKLTAPDFTLSAIDEYASPVVILPIQTARGCSWRKCKFCSHHNGYFGKYNCWSIKLIVDYIVEIKDKYNCMHIVLHDDDIPANRLILLAREIKKRGVSIKIVSYVRPTEEFLSEGLLEELYNSGFIAYSWGVESGSQKILDCVQKGTKIKTIENILKSSSLIGASNICWIIINLPSETIQDFNETMSFMNQLKNSVDLWMISPFRMQFDSPLYSDVEIENQTKKVPMEYSQALSEEQKCNENNKVKTIEILYSQGYFHNNRFSKGLIPISCQRARIVPFIYASNTTTLFDDNTIFISQYREMLMDNKVILKSIDFNNDVIILDNDKYDRLLDITNHIIECDDEINELINKLCDMNFAILIKNDKNDQNKILNVSNNGCQ